MQLLIIYTSLLTGFKIICVCADPFSVKCTTRMRRETWTQTEIYKALVEQILSQIRSLALCRYLIISNNLPEKNTIESRYQTSESYVAIQGTCKTAGQINVNVVFRSHRKIPGRYRINTGGLTEMGNATGQRNVWEVFKYGNGLLQESG